MNETNTALDLQRFEAQKQLLVQAYMKIHKTLDELTETQERLIESEKLAVLGQLTAGVAHEINTPIGAIQSSSTTLQNTLTQAVELALACIPDLDENHIKLATELIIPESIDTDYILLSRKEKQALKEEYQEKIDASSLLSEIDSELLDQLVSFGILDSLEKYYPLLKLKVSNNLFRMIRKLRLSFGSTWVINNSVEKVSKIVFALKDYSHKSKGEKTNININYSINNVLAIYKSNLKKMEVVRNFKEIPTVWGDTDRIAQVWTNLLTNAIDASEQTGKIEIGTYVTSDYVHVYFKDFGFGIKPEIKKELFKPFFTTKGVGEGTGLGLSIVKNILDEHHGSIQVESQEKQGTTFIVKLKTNQNENII